MSAEININGNPDLRSNIAIRINFVTNLECDTPAKLSQIIHAEAMINPCLVIEEDGDIDNLNDQAEEGSDLTEEESLTLDGDLEDDPDTFAGEEIEEPEAGDNDTRYVLSKRETFEDIEDALDEEEVEVLLDAMCESQATYKEFQDEFDNLARHRDRLPVGIEPFLTVRRNEKKFETEVRTLPGISRLSLNEELRYVMKDKYKEALDLIAAVNAHREIIHRIAHLLTVQQKDFFTASDYQTAVLALKSYSQTDMAAAIGVHKSTIARIVKGKVVETNFGYVMLQTLFGRKSALQKGGSGVPSQVKLKMLKDYIESKATVPGDAEIQRHFKINNIDITLEMIRYYRKRLGIIKKRGRKQ